ncbi:Virulence regulon transcriptional activator VirF [Shewanella khirikhana]|uniref:Virulence regulon transcriptional activator VirF n=2 Tax=Shewanella khirikhana TaxID=1965282 RepID=A0ABN5TV45_9GAMM|nr:Virulence regulon transcriptional activator VirF [Shewanella khirikhana]
MNDHSPEPGLERLLSGLELSATLFFRGWVCDSWQTDTSGTGLASFHLLVAGKAWLHRPHLAPLALTAGDMLLFTKDTPHQLSFSAEPPAQMMQTPTHWPLGQTQGSAAPSQMPSQMSSEAPSEPTALICGHFDFREDKLHPLLASLPVLIHIRRDQRIGALDGLLTALIDEASRDANASEVILTRLCEAFFQCMLRQLPADEQSKLAILSRQPGLARVLDKMHSEPDAPWSLESLAAVGFYSRTRFATLFKDFTGLTPLAYLNRLRLIRARKSLLAGNTVAAVAEQAGYSDEAAFSKAYKRLFGGSPGQTRRLPQQGAST